MNQDETSSETHLVTRLLNAGSTPFDWSAHIGAVAELYPSLLAGAGRFARSELRRRAR